MNNSARDSNDAVEEESRRVRKVRLAVDLTAAILRQQEPLNVMEAHRLIEDTRRVAAMLCPDTEGTFDLVIRPRYMRILEERRLIG